MAAVADRAIVFVDGMLTQELYGDALTEHQLVAAISGRYRSSTDKSGSEQPCFPPI